MTYKIPFNKPHLTGKEFDYIKNSIQLKHLSGNGEFTKKTQLWLKNNIGCKKALLTDSCSDALEIAAILADIRPGDEIIMPSYTFVSTANSFVLRGGIPVFVDIRPDTLNIDETKIEEAITAKTKAIVPVHYAGVGCEMNVIQEIAKRHNLLVIEDAAQGIMSTYEGKPLGGMGDLGAISFHETKNISSGEGGVLLINNPIYAERAEIIWEKGTNRAQFFRGEIDKYTWVDIGSSFLPSDMKAAFLLAQLEEAQLITQKRLKIWNQYHQGLAKLEKQGKIHRPIIPSQCQHNGHLYYILLENLDIRTQLIEYLKKNGVWAVFHYIPLHSSPAGLEYTRVSGHLKNTDQLSERLLRLPFYYDLEEDEINFVIDKIFAFFQL